ncbi:MAG: ankyrin repeat domain-containing protein [Acidobacteria bacterium]|nr:ankyrin repeat domain-containing protein [Acidobacteriota bacterium]
MKRNLRIIDHVQVKSPCTEDWNEMVGNDEVRFCSHCSKHVHNLSAMTRHEAEKLVLESNGNLCIRYLRRPEDQQIVTLPDWMDRPALRRLVLPVAAGVMAVALNTAPSMAQKAGSSKPVIKVQDPPSPGKKTMGPMHSNRASSGQVTQTTQTPGSASSGGDTQSPSVLIEPVPALDQTLCPRPITELPIHGGDVLVGLTIGMPSNLMSTNPGISSRRPAGSELLRAVENRNAPTVLSFLKQGIQPNGRNEHGETALMLVGNSKTIAKYLVRYGADVNARNQVGTTPLMYAMLQDKTFIPKLLIAGGADVNAADQWGRTALMIAAFEGKPKFIKLLIKTGAKVEFKDQFGKTALDYASDAESKSVILLLKAAGAKVSTRY